MSTAADLNCRRLLALAALCLAMLPAVAAERSWKERLSDSEDGAFDLSDWLLEQRGFLPVPIVITEPAVGYGGGLGLMFFRESLGEAAERAKRTGRLAPPDIYGLAAFGTENGSKGGAGGGMLSFDDDRYRWRGGIGYASVNLDFYGPGGDQRPLGYNLDGWFSVQHAMMRLGQSDSWLVGRWNYLQLDSTFDAGDRTPFGPLQMASRASGLGVSLEFDSRDNIFTPNRGATGSLDLTFYDPAWSSDTEFQAYRAHLFAYWPLAANWILGGRLDLRAAEGDVPFYMLPYVDLRGVPAMRLQDTRVGAAELELRWNVTPRWALVGFAGGGQAWGSSGSFGDGTETFAKGIGFRYFIARRLGLWAGIDTAWSTQDKAVYIQVGNAWR